MSDATTGNHNIAAAEYFIDSAGANGSGTAMGAPTRLLTPAYRTDFFCVAVRRVAWQQLGGLDPVFGLG